MTDSSQGPGWWQASDGKWYAPEAHPDFGGAPTEAVEAASTPPEPPQAPPAPPSPPVPPTEAMPAAGPPAGPPLGAPGGPPPGAPGGPPPGAPGAGGSSNARWIVLGVLGAVIIAIVAFLLLRGGDDKKNNVAANSTTAASDTTGSTDTSSSSTKSTSSSSTKSSSSGAGPGQLSKAEIDKRLVKAADIGPDFSDSAFKSTSLPTPCGDPPINDQVPPKIDTGNDATSGALFFEEEVLTYDSEASANEALTLFEQQINCTDPTIGSGQSASFSGPDDVSSLIDSPVDAAVQIIVQTEEANGVVVAVRMGNAVAVFQFVGQQGADTSSVPSPDDLVNLGVSRLLA